MKRLLALLLCLCLVLAACGPTPPATEPTTAPTTGPAAKPTTAPTETTTPPTEPEETVLTPTEPVVVDLPMSAIVLTAQQEILNEAGFAYTYQNVRLYLANEAASEPVMLELLNRMDATRSNAEAAMNSGSSGYAVTYTPTRIDAGVLSLSGTENSFSREGHPMTVCTGVTYDLTTGQVVTLEDILTDSANSEIICRLVVDALAALENEANLYSDYSATVENRFSGDFHADEAWYLSRAGLCFAFAPYEVAPYSAGIVTATVPYDQLPGILEDAWFPVEHISTEGDLSAVLFAEVDQTAIDLYAEVVLEPEGEEFLLYSGNLLYHVTVETGSWNMAGTEFIPDATVFYADHITAGDGIMVQTYVPDTMPNIRITYLTDSGVTQVFLSQSGEDGSALLLSC